MPARMPRMRLRDPDLLRTLMEATGDGTRATVRDLADAAGTQPSTIGKLLTGERMTVPASTAAGICRRIGVDLLVLWAPAERTLTGAPAPNWPAACGVA